MPTEFQTCDLCGNHGSVKNNVSILFNVWPSVNCWFLLALVRDLFYNLLVIITKFSSL
jgi:hypothetical protein